MGFHKLIFSPSFSLSFLKLPLRIYDRKCARSAKSVRSRRRRGGRASAGRGWHMQFLEAENSIHAVSACQMRFRRRGEQNQRFSAIYFCVDPLGILPTCRRDMRAICLAGCGGSAERGRKRSLASTSNKRRTRNSAATFEELSIVSLTRSPRRRQCTRSRPPAPGPYFHSPLLFVASERVGGREGERERERAGGR